jgi:hypothetical protein
MKCPECGMKTEGVCANCASPQPKILLDPHGPASRIPEVKALMEIAVNAAQQEKDPAEWERLIAEFKRELPRVVGLVELRAASGNADAMEVLRDLRTMYPKLTH